MPAIDSLLDQLIARGGGDLYLAEGHPPLTRVLGKLVPIEDAPLDAAAVAELVLPLLPAALTARFDVAKDVEFVHAHGDQARFRATYFEKSSGVAAVFRTIPATIPSLAELGLPDVARRLAERRSGLVLVAGPAGAGISTSLAAMVGHINQTRACHILTLEAPGEFVHAPVKAQITRREIGEHAPTFAAALRAAMRDDADVVLVGELRDAESIVRAVELAASGVLVLAGLRAGGVRGAVDRVLAAFPEREQALGRALVAESLAGVVAQHLLPTADGSGHAVAV